MGLPFLILTVAFYSSVLSSPVIDSKCITRTPEVDTQLNSIVEKMKDYLQKLTSEQNFEVSFIRLDLQRSSSHRVETVVDLHVKACPNKPGQHKSQTNPETCVATYPTGDQTVQRKPPKVIRAHFRPKLYETLKQIRGSNSQKPLLVYYKNTDEDVFNYNRRKAGKRSHSVTHDKSLEEIMSAVRQGKKAPVAVYIEKEGKQTAYVFLKN